MTDLSITEKRCIKCGKFKPRSEFHRDATQKDGLRFYCRDCVKTVKKYADPTRPLPVLVPHFIPRTKRCHECGQTKPLGDFYYQKPGVAIRRVVRRCRQCAHNHRVNSESVRGAAYPTANTRMLAKRATLKYKYKLPYDEYLRLEGEQAGACAICKLPPPEGKSLCVDHHHITGRVRGLLCVRCNAVLGMARENVEVLSAAVRYLEEYGQLEQCSDVKT